MKKIKTACLALMGLLCSFDASAFKVDGIEYDFTKDGNNVRVIYGNQKFSGDAVIPAEILYNGKTYPVVMIDNDAFRNCATLTSVEIPNSVTSIGTYSFAGCEALDAVVIPESITSIGKNAFDECKTLNSVTFLTKSLSEIAPGTFRYCFALETIKIPSPVKTIGTFSFFKCDALKNIEIPNSVNTIGEGAFRFCTALESVELPNSVTTIGQQAFADCTRLTSISVSNALEKIERQAFMDCSSLASFEIPNTVNTLGIMAFANCGSLTSLEFPSSITNFGDDVFKGCDSLSTLTIHNAESFDDTYTELPFPTAGFKTYTTDVSDLGMFQMYADGTLIITGDGVCEVTVTGTDMYNQPKTRVMKLTIGGQRVNIGDTGYATFSIPSAYQVPEELQAGIVEVKGDRANLTLLDPTTSCYPAGEALILKGKPGEYLLPTPTRVAVLEKNANNDLKAALTNNQINAEAGNELFVLSNGNSGLGFYYQMGCPDGSFVKDLKGKAYLELSKASLMGLKSLHLYDGEVTGIDEVETENGGDAVVYSLSGVRMNQSVHQLPKGVYIVNGKKVMVK